MIFNLIYHLIEIVELYDFFIIILIIYLKINRYSQLK